MKITHILAIATAAIAAVPAAAQDPSAASLNGEVTLSSGFNNDPRVVNVVAGGTIDATRLGGQCRGVVAANPDYKVNYTAGSLPLIISVSSRADTTLVINGPDGRWYCDDDGGNGNNPSVRFNNPQSGRYDIFVGTYSAGTPQPARLHISELTSQ
jgi:hypothetical protein